MFISLYLALIYLNPLSELGLALPLHRKKLSDVMVADYGFFTLVVRIIKHYTLLVASHLMSDKI